MAALLAGYSEIAARLTPLHAMRGDATTPSTPVGDKVGQFVPEDTLSNGVVEFPEPWVEINVRGAGTGGACSGLQPGIPRHPDRRCEIVHGKFGAQPLRQRRQCTVLPSP